MLTDTALAFIKNELTTDPETLGYTGDAGGDHIIMVLQRSYSPLQYLQVAVNPAKLALILIGRGKWKNVVDVVATNDDAFKLVEAAKLSGITVGWSIAETIVTNLIPSVLSAADGLALQDALRVEDTYNRAAQLGYPKLTVGDVQSAIDYTP